MSAGGHHTCGVATDGTTYCWGSNASGQLGIGTADSAPRPAPLLVTGGLTFATVSAAGGNTCSPTPLYVPYCWAAGYTCGVTAVGAAQCWGNNQYGQIGNGSTTASSIPVPVSGGLTFETVSATDSYSCGLTTTGAAFCWGDNQFGQLGNGSTTASSIPVPVSGGLSFANVSAGGDHTCGVTTGGAAYCWGNNQSGQLGDGSTTSSTTPVLVRRS